MPLTRDTSGMYDALATKLQALLNPDLTSVFTTVLAGSQSATISSTAATPAAFILETSSTWDDENPELGKVSFSVVMLIHDYTRPTGEFALTGDNQLSDMRRQVIEQAGHLARDGFMAAINCKGTLGPEVESVSRGSLFMMTLNFEGILG